MFQRPGYWSVRILACCADQKDSRQASWLIGRGCGGTVRSVVGSRRDRRIIQSRKGRKGMTEDALNRSRALSLGSMFRSRRV